MEIRPATQPEAPAKASKEKLSSMLVYASPSGEYPVRRSSTGERTKTSAAPKKLDRAAVKAPVGVLVLESLTTGS